MALQHEYCGPNRFLRWINQLFCYGWHRLPKSDFRLPDGPVILVGNHLCGLDPLLLQASLARPVCFLMSRDYYQGMWYLRRGFDWVGAIPVSPGGANRQGLKIAIEKLAAGNVLCLFPEGAANPPVPLARILPGAALLARQSGAPVIPFRVSGVWPFDHKHLWRPFYRCSRARIEFGEPICFPDDGLSGREAIARDCDLIRHSIRALRGNGRSG